MTMWKYFYFSICLLSTAVEAEPRVIADLGGEPSGIESPQELLSEQVSKTGAIPKPENITISQFPVISKLRSGITESRSHSQPTVRPFFIVGDDQLSHEWLMENQSVLKATNALGIVANVVSKHAFESIKASVPHIPLIAAPADEIAKVYGLDVYPVLVTQREILQ